MGMKPSSGGGTAPPVSETGMADSATPISPQRAGMRAANREDSDMLTRSAATDWFGRRPADLPPPGKIHRALAALPLRVRFPMRVSNDARSPRAWLPPLLRSPVDSSPASPLPPIGRPLALAPAGHSRSAPARAVAPGVPRHLLEDPFQRAWASAQWML